jgi:nicotinamidase-related amidase
MKTALLMIDIQKDYFKGGRNELANTEKAITYIKQVLSLFRERGLSIFHVQHIALGKGASFFLPDTEGVKIHEQVAPQLNESLIIKHTPDSFFQTELHKRLSANNIKRLVVCGMMSHMCIDTTVRTAKQMGYEVVVISDACTTKDLVWNGTVIPAETVHSTFMASLQGTFAQVIEASGLCNIL